MIEILIVAVLVLWSTCVVVKKVFPQTSNAILQKLSSACEQKGWMTLAQWLKPKQSAGCGGNCACPVSEDSKPKTQVSAVKWK